MKTTYYQDTKKGLTCDHLIREGELPFVPRSGLNIDCGDGDFRRVEEVFYNARTGEIGVYFYDTTDTVRKLKTNGWRRQGQKP